MDNMSELNRRTVLAATAAAGAYGLAASAASAAPVPGGGSAIRPFSFHAPDEALADLRRRIQATKWPDQEQVSDTTQGVQLATMQSLVRHWASDHDWRKVEARLNALPQF